MKMDRFFSLTLLAGVAAAAVATLSGCGGGDGTAHAAEPVVVPKGPAGTSFWDVHSAPPATAKAGDILYAQERTDAPQGSRGWNVVYVSEVQDGLKKYVSGEIYVPNTAPQSPREVVLWNHETTGLQDACSPSRRSLDLGDHTRVPALNEMLAKGYVVAMSDYPGQGLPGPSWYMSGQPNARASLDVLRAVQKMPEAKAGKRVVMYGWSQGGQTTMWADAIAPTYAPEFEILGAGLIAPAVRIRELTLNSMKHTANAGYVMSTLPGIKAAYPSLRYSDFLTTEAMEQIPAVADGCFDIWDAGAAVKNPYQADAMKEGSPWWNAMTDADNFTPRGKTPFVIYQGSADTDVPESLTLKERDALCKAGSRVTYNGFAGLGHIDVVPVAAQQFPAWAQERFAGQAAASNCPAP